MCLAVPMMIKTVLPGQMAAIELGGVERHISLVMTPEVQAGDYVLIHAGFAISRLDTAEAEETLRLLRELAEGEDDDPPDSLG